MFVDDVCCWESPFESAVLAHAQDGISHQFRSIYLFNVVYMFIYVLYVYMLFILNVIFYFPYLKFIIIINIIVIRLYIFL